MKYYLPTAYRLLTTVQRVTNLPAMLRKAMQAGSYRVRELESFFCKFEIACPPVPGFGPLRCEASRRGNLKFVIPLSLLLISLILPQNAFAQTPNSLNDLVNVFRTIVNYVAVVAILVFLIMMFVGGFQFFFSGGDEKAISKARSTLTYALIGLVVLVMVWFVLLAVKEVTGINVTIFNLVQP